MKKALLFAFLMFVMGCWIAPTMAGDIRDVRAKALYQQLQKSKDELAQAKRDLQSVRAESARRDAELANLKSLRQNNDMILAKLKLLLQVLPLPQTRALR